MTLPFGERSKSSSQLIYEQIRQKILDFEFYPGSRVTESELAQQFEVSRTPVRAALQRLETEGLISVLPKQGCFIRAVDIDLVSQYYDVRITLEAAAVELACDHMSAEVLEGLAELWDPKRVEQGIDLEALQAEEEAFHMTIALESGNTILAAYLRDINDHIRIIRRLGFPDLQSVLDTCVEHSTIISLIQQGNKTSAKQYMSKHIKKSQALAKSVTAYQLQKSLRK